MQRIALDADGVIFNFDAAWRRVGSDVLQRDLVARGRTYDFSQRYALNPGEEGLVWEAFHQREGIKSAPALPGAVEAVSTLIEAGYDVHILTAISPDHQQQRVACLRHYGLPEMPVHCVGADGTKETWLRDLAPAAYVDDRLKHLHEAARVGVPVRIWLDDGLDQCTSGRPGLISHRVYTLTEAVGHILASPTLGVPQASPGIG